MKKGKSKKTGLYIIIGILLVLLYTCGNNQSTNPDTTTPQNQTTENTTKPGATADLTDIPVPTDTVTPTVSAAPTLKAEGNPSVYKYKKKSYMVIEVDGGDLSGQRQPNVAVDIGYGDRVYWALTNQYGQLVYVIADKIILQNPEKEPVLSNGRYYNDEAKVPGTELEDYDEGHIIADSLGGVSNAYNITPQNSVLNRYGDQAYMEKIIRDAGGCSNFVATITYPNTSTQIPSRYKYEYEINGNKIVDEFDNIDPDEANRNLTDTNNATAKKEESNKSDSGKNEVKSSSDTNKSNASNNKSFNEKAELAKIDTNGNGKVSIAEAKAAGYSMPIYSDHWLYKYMDDRDGDGMVGE